MSGSTSASWFSSADLPESHTWSGRPDADAIAPLPGAPAVYLLIDEHQQPVQLATTQNLKRLCKARLLDESRAERGQADLAAIARGVRWRQVTSPFESRWWYYRLVRHYESKGYRKLIGFGPAWFLNVDWTARVPEIKVTERVWRDSGAFVGPFPARRQAQQALEGLWDLFDLCRYPEQVRKAPQGQRCAYAEMGRCDAPCDGSVPLEPYVTRCRAAWAFASGAVAAWAADAEQRMQAAARQLAFEQAGLLKQQLAFAKNWQQKWCPQVAPIEHFNLFLALPVTRRKARKLFLFARGALVAGPTVPDRKLATEAPAWLESALRETLPAANANTAPVQQMEQTWLVAHLLNNKEADHALIIRLPQLDEAEPGVAAGHVQQMIEESARIAAEQGQEAKPRSDEAAG